MRLLRPLLSIAASLALVALAPAANSAPPSAAPAETDSDGTELAVELDPLDYFPLLRAGMSLELGFAEHHAIKASAYVLDDFHNLSSYEVEYRHFSGPRQYSGFFFGVAAFAKSVSYDGKAPNRLDLVPTTAWTTGIGVDVGWGWRWGDVCMSAGGGLEAFALLGHPLPDDNAGEHAMTLLFGQSRVLPRAVLTIGYVL